MNAERLRSAVQSIAADLRARRMVPVIVLLIAMIVAIPIVLGRSAATAGPTTPVAVLPATTSTQTTAPTGTRTATSTTHHAGSAATGSGHDPFIQPAAPPESTAGSGSSSGRSGGTAGVTSLPVTASPKSDSSAVHTGSSPTSSAGATDSHSTTTTTTTQTTATSTHTTSGTPMYSAYRVGVAFGSASGPDRSYRNLPRDAMFVDHGTPVLVFLGVAKDGHSGIFFLASGVTPAGEGNCSPSRSKCQFLILQPHDYVLLIDHTSSGAVSVDTLTFGTPLRVTSPTPLVTQISTLGARTIAWAAPSVPQLRAMSYDPSSGVLLTGKLPQVAAGAAAIPQAVAASLTPIS